MSRRPAQRQQPAESIKSVLEKKGFRIIDNTDIYAIAVDKMGNTQLVIKSTADFEIADDAPFSHLEMANQVYPSALGLAIIDGDNSVLIYNTGGKFATYFLQIAGRHLLPTVLISDIKESEFAIMNSIEKASAKLFDIVSLSLTERITTLREFSDVLSDTAYLADAEMNGLLSTMSSLAVEQKDGATRLINYPPQNESQSASQKRIIDDSHETNSALSELYFLLPTLGGAVNSTSDAVDAINNARRTVSSAVGSLPHVNAIL